MYQQKIFEPEIFFSDSEMQGFQYSSKDRRRKINLLDLSMKKLMIEFINDIFMYILKLSNWFSGWIAAVMFSYEFVRNK